MHSMLHSALPPAEELTLVPLADIARGGMGMVQLCRIADGRLAGREVAVKRLNPGIELDPEFVNMFLDETWITATINSPHVVRVEAWGRDEIGMFLAVELVQGVSLSRLMKESRDREEPFAERTVANIASQVCAGLQAAHELRGENGAVLGLVHRDLTPGNVLVSFDGLVKIADFGIAKAEERLTSTRIGMMKGKPAYMAPEQARGGGIDGRADVFALGVVMFEMLTGKRPWTGANDLETLIAVSTQPAPKVEDSRRVSPIFASLVDRCLQKNPDRRHASAREVREILDAWRAERGFDRDDQASLAAFVRRNTQQQQEWFAEALHGKLSRGGVTFMDLEAKIDKSRTAAPQSIAKPPPNAATAAPTSAVQALLRSTSTPMPAQSAEPDDEEAKTRFIENRAPFPMAPAAGAAPVAMTPSGGADRGFGSTIALTSEQHAALTSSLALPPNTRSPLQSVESAGANGPQSVARGPFSPGPAQQLPSMVFQPSIDVRESSAGAPPTFVDQRASNAPPIAPGPISPAPVAPTTARRSALVFIGPLLLLVLVGAAAAYYLMVMRHS
ncbi:MAG: serine/threonine-protein kinase [Polyangiaceae bacterium]